MRLTRHKARAIALEILYQFDISNGDIEDIIHTQLEGKNIPKDVKDFILRLTRGVWQHKGEVDKHIEVNAEHWSIDRITVIDRSILRLAIFELLYCADIPFKVIIDEAVELGKIYGAENSGAFINGILDKVAKRIPSRKEETREISLA